MISVISVIFVLFFVTQPPGGDVQAHVARGVSWLHSFEYEEAIEEFRAAQKADPGFVMAYWGEAMCHSQPLWGREDVAAARRVFGRLGATASARAAKAKTPRERAYLAAVERLFGDPSTSLRGSETHARQVSYSEAMRALAEQNPSDLDAQAFYGLSLLALRPRGVGSFDHSADHSVTETRLKPRPTPASSSVGRDASVGRGFSLVSANADDFSPKAAEIFQRVLAVNPDHPGALHYKIHAFDDPVNAPKALDAARRYAKVAPEATHALHMPAHIFVQLGEWNDAVASDTAAYRASVEWAKRKGLPESTRSFHSLEWLHYEYLQLGEYRKAADAIAEIEPIAAASESPEIKTMVGLMKARQVLESENWASLKGQQQYRNYVELYALGFSAAKRGEMKIAEFVRAEISRLPADPTYRALATPLAILERHINALIEMKSGRSDAAVDLMKAAVAAEESRSFSSGPAEPVKPSSELLGEILLELNRPEEARAAFEASLRRVPGRRASLGGLARAKAPGATAPPPDAATAPWSARPVAITAGAVVAGLIVVVVFSIRRRSRPVSRQQRRRAQRHS